MLFEECPVPASSLVHYDTYDEMSPLMSRFSIAILSSVLIGMALGKLLTRSVETLTGAAGVLGLFYYAYRLWFIHRNWEALQSAIRVRVENRLEVLATTMRPSNHLGDRV